MIEKILIQNFKIFSLFEVALNNDLNLIVGDNETGKSTLLEAISLALTKKLGGRPAEYELSPYLFNKQRAEAYVKSVNEDQYAELPKILIELYLADEPDLQFLRGSNNFHRKDCVGVKVEIEFDEEYNEDYAQLLQKRSEIRAVPVEYYKVNWYSFANGPITQRSVPLGLSNIDATTIRLQSGTDYYLQNIIAGNLGPKKRVALTIAYRRLKEQFSNDPLIAELNNGLSQRKGAVTEKDLAIGIDISQRSNWESSLVPHLDELPFHLIGKGEQSALKILLALERDAEASQIVLIEEPENHLSFSSMSKLISTIQGRCSGKQIVIATHSAYVLNKLGIEKVILLNNMRTLSLNELSGETQNYFKKLSGYDTLRLILAKRAILVEGPSDELIVQKAYLLKHGKLPLENGVDVINVRGLSFARFLDIAKALQKDVAVVTDNDGDYEKHVATKYRPYESLPNIKICADRDEESHTLELQIIKINERTLLNEIFGTEHADAVVLTDYMLKNKTECALKIFETSKAIRLPEYIQNAVQ
jgi:putative ATP-dependent endonuclease of OLD family